MAEKKYEEIKGGNGHGSVEEFLEPEGRQTLEVYVNGISTSLPFDVQFEFVRSMKGFENAHITRPGYAIEYDFFDPRGLHAHLETKHVPGLFFAGQINGTTGYEEAACQGMMAVLEADAMACWISIQGMGSAGEPKYSYTLLRKSSGRLWYQPRVVLLSWVPV